MKLNLGPGLQQISQQLAGMAQTASNVQQRRQQLYESSRQHAYQSGSTLADTKLQMEAYDWLKQADAKLLSGEMKAEDAGNLLADHLRGVYETNRQSWFGDDDLAGMFESEALEPFIVKMYQTVDAKALEISDKRTVENAGKTVEAAFQSLQGGANPVSVWETVNEARQTAYAVQPVTPEQKAQDDTQYANRFNSIVTSNALGALVSGGTVNEDRAFIIIDRLTDGQSGDQYADEIRGTLQGPLDQQTAAEVRTLIGKQVDDIQKANLNQVKSFVRETASAGLLIDTASIEEMALNAPARHRVGYYEAMQLANGYNDDIYVSQVEQALYSGDVLAEEWWPVINQITSQATRSRLSREALTNLAEAQPNKDLAYQAIMASGAAMSDKRTVAAKYIVQNTSADEFTYEDATRVLYAVQSGPPPVYDQLNLAVTPESTDAASVEKDITSGKITEAQEPFIVQTNDGQEIEIPAAEAVEVAPEDTKAVAFLVEQNFAGKEIDETIYNELNQFYFAFTGAVEEPITGPAKEPITEPIAEPETLPETEEEKIEPAAQQPQLTEAKKAELIGKANTIADRYRTLVGASQALGQFKAVRKAVAANKKRVSGFVEAHVSYPEPKAETITEPVETKAIEEPKKIEANPALARQIVQSRDVRPAPVVPKVAPKAETAIEPTETLPIEKPVPIEPIKANPTLARQIVQSRDVRTAPIVPKAETITKPDETVPIQEPKPIEANPALARQIVQDRDVRPAPVVPKAEVKESQSYLNGLAAASWLRLEQKEQDVAVRAPVSEGMSQDDIAQNIIYNKAQGYMPTVAEYMLLDSSGRSALMDTIDKLDMGEPAVSDPASKTTLINLWKDTGYSDDALKDYGQLLFLSGLITKQDADDWTKRPDWLKNENFTQLNAFINEKTAWMKDSDLEWRIKTDIYQDLVENPQYMKSTKDFNLYKDQINQLVSQGTATAYLGGLVKISKAMNDGDAAKAMSKTSFNEFMIGVRDGKYDFAIDLALQDSIPVRNAKYASFAELLNIVSNQMYGYGYDELDVTSPGYGAYQQSRVMANTMFRYSAAIMEDALASSLEIQPKSMERVGNSWAFEDPMVPGLFYRAASYPSAEGGSEGIRWELFRMEKRNGVYDPSSIGTFIPMPVHATLDISKKVLETEAELSQVQAMKRSQDESLNKWWLQPTAGSAGITMRPDYSGAIADAQKRLDTLKAERQAKQDFIQGVRESILHDLYRQPRQESSRWRN